MLYSCPNIYNSNNQEKGFCEYHEMELDEGHVGHPVWRKRRQSDIIIF